MASSRVALMLLLFLLVIAVVCLVANAAGILN